MTQSKFCVKIKIYQIKGGGKMIKTNKRLNMLFAAFFLIVLIAEVLRIAELNTASPFFNKLCVFGRTFLYIGTFSVWGFSVNQRIMQTQVRKFLTVISALMVFWIAVREIKFRFVISPAAIRYLWYSYYLPILFIPLLAVLVSLSLGKAEGFHLPKKTALLFIVPVCLFALVLTNDFHQLAFIFPQSEAIKSEAAYSYGIVFYLCVLWVTVCAICSLGFMLSESRIPNSRQHLWIAVIPFALALLYVFIYSLRLPVIMKYFGDVAAVDCLLFTGFFEICIQCGLIQSNSRYNDLFRASVKLPLLITDKAYHLRYACANAPSVGSEDIINAQSSPVIIDGKKRLSVFPIDGGYAVFAQDISSLLLARDELAAVREELTERGALLELEYKKEQEHRKIEEQNKLYDLLQRSTQERLNRIDLLVKEYKQENDEDKKKLILAEIAVIGSYIKRRKDFVLSSYGTKLLSPAMLESAFSESFRALSLLNIKGSVYIETDEPLIKAGLLTEAYDFFEAVLEALLNDIRYVSVSLSRVNGALRICITTDYEGALPEDISLDGFKGAKAVSEDGTRFILPLEACLKEAEL